MEVRDDGLVTPIETSKGWRRSIYVIQRRTQLPTLLENFDMPAMSPNCWNGMFHCSAASAQSSQQCHDPEAAQSLAERVRKEAGDDSLKQVERVYWIAYGRSATEEEKRLCLEALNRVAEPESRSSSSRAMGDRKIAASVASSSSKKTELVLDQKKNEPGILQA